MTTLPRDTPVSSAGFETSIPEIERSQTYPLYLKASRIREHLPLTLQDLNLKCLLIICSKLLLYIAVKSDLTVYHSED